MKIVIDACTVILLAKATVLEPFTQAFGIIVTKDVLDEVIQGKQKLFDDALIIERLQKEKKIKLEIVPGRVVAKLADDFGLGKGEASVIATAIKENAIVATDNRQGRKAAIIHGLPLIGSIEIIVSMYKKKLVSAEKARSSLKKLKEHGWFDSYLIDKAMEDIQ